MIKKGDCKKCVLRDKYQIECIHTYMPPWPKVPSSIHLVTFWAPPHLWVSTSFKEVMFGFLAPLHPRDESIFVLQIVNPGISRPSGSGGIVEEETRIFCFWNLSTETRPKMIQNIIARLMFSTALTTCKKYTCISVYRFGQDSFFKSYCQILIAKDWSGGAHFEWTSNNL